MNKPHILIATPVSNGNVTVEYFDSIVKLLKSYNFEFTVQIYEGTELYKLRNAFAAKFTHSKRFSHLLFIDSDMSFEPNLIEKLVRFDKPFVGVLAPYRKNQPETGKLNFVCEQFIKKDTFTDGFVQSSAIGTGILLLKPEVFEVLEKNYTFLFTGKYQTYYKDKCGIEGKVHQPFAPMQIGSGDFLGEDLSFCKRWIDSSGEIWVNVDEKIGHTGTKTYCGSFWSVKKCRCTVIG